MSVTTLGAPDATYIITGTDSWQATPTSWVDLPGATIPLSLGQGTSVYGAVYIATFSAEAMASAANDNGVVTATVFFGDTQPAPSSDNHRYVTARGNPEWSSHTFIRTVSFPIDISSRDVTAQVKFGGSNGVTAGIMNWALKVERYNL